MEQKQLEYPPLSLSELGDLLGRHVENVAVANVIKDAMRRRLTDTSEPAIS
jgi:hypothetical protein